MAQNANNIVKKFVQHHPPPTINKLHRPTLKPKICYIVKDKYQNIYYSIMDKNQRYIVSFEKPEIAYQECQHLKENINNKYILKELSLEYLVSKSINFALGVFYIHENGKCFFQAKKICNQEIYKCLNEIIKT